MGATGLGGTHSRLKLDSSQEKAYGKAPGNFWDTPQRLGDNESIWIGKKGSRAGKVRAGNGPQQVDHGTDLGGGCCPRTVEKKNVRASQLKNRRQRSNKKLNVGRSQKKRVYGGGKGPDLALSPETREILLGEGGLVHRCGPEDARKLDEENGSLLSKKKEENNGFTS